MTDGPHAGRWVGILASAAFARAYTITVLGSVFSAFAVEKIAGRVTYVTIIVGLCVIGIGMLIARRREISLVRLVPTTVVLFVAWAFASVFWSQDASGSFWSWVCTAALAFLAVTIGHVRDTLQTVRALGDVLRVLLSISLGVEILSGVLLDMPIRFLGIQGNIAQLGPIQGIFGTRNLLGFIAVIALITFLIEYRTQSVRVGVSVFSVVLAGGLAVLCDSPTVLVLAVAVGLAVGALALVRHAKPDGRSALQWTLGGIVVAALAIGYARAASDHRAPRSRFGLLDSGQTCGTRWSTIVRTKPVQGWGWFGAWNPDEFPFSAINYTLGRATRPG